VAFFDKIYLIHAKFYLHVGYQVIWGRILLEVSSNLKQSNLGWKEVFEEQRIGL
jgi:hypothetical protein